MRIDWDSFIKMLLSSLVGVFYILGFVLCIAMENAWYLLFWIPAVIIIMLLMSAE